MNTDYQNNKLWTTLIGASVSDMFCKNSYWQAANLTKPCIVGKNAVNIFVCALAI